MDYLTYRQVIGMGYSTFAWMIPVGDGLEPLLWDPGATMHQRPPGPSWGRGRVLSVDQGRQLPTSQHVRTLIDEAAAGHGRR